MRLIKSVLYVTMIFILTGCVSPGSPTQIPPSITPQPTRVVFLPTMTPLPSPTAAPMGMQSPPKGFLYHGVFPGGRSGEEDDITPNDLISYERAVGKDATWVYFSNNWFRSRNFPTETAEWIRDMGSIPYIRLMPRHDLKYEGEDTAYSLQSILDGDFDRDLQTWCAGARNFSTNMIVEYGTEVNSDSFVWSGVHNGGGETTGYGDPSLPDGPERFKDVYRHIIDICRQEGAANITWVFHIDSANHPDENWNRIENYYPGDEWIDWFGVSIYGASRPDSTYFDVFSLRLNTIYQQIVRFAPHKPIIVAEFGTAKDNLLLDQTQWTKDALSSLDTERYPNLIGFSWWNERWQNDGRPQNDTTMRVQDNPELEELFQELVGNNPNILGKIAQ